MANGDNSYLSKIEEICRICLSKHNKMISLLTKKENTTLLNMFTSFTSIKVKFKDGLPLQICEVCETDALNCYQFIIRCKKSNSILKALVRKELKNGKKEKNIIKKSKSSLSNDGEYIKKYVRDKVELNNKKIIHKEEFIENRNETQIQMMVDEAAEVEYLEDDIFETELLKNNMVQCSSEINAENEVFNYLGTGVKEESKEVREYSNKGKRKYYLCSLCPKKFVKKSTLRAHEKLAHARGVGAVTSGGDAVTSGGDAVTSGDAVTCAQCGAAFNCEQDLYVHGALHAGEPWRCLHCHKEFRERGQLRRHVQRHMSVARHACERCGKRFSERCALRRHARVHTGQAAEKRFACHACDKRFVERAALRAHALRHAGRAPCACDACGKAFRSPRLLASHRRVHSDRKPHACAYCDKRFRHASTRDTHHRTHTGERPYVCAVCGKCFIQNSNLTLHMRTHTGERPYPCDACERRFSSRSALASHRRAHDAADTVECPVCRKMFARQYIRAHKRQHSGERPYACCVCAKRFTNAGRLRQHNYMHTGEKPFQCEICSRRFITRGYLGKHLKNHEMIKKLKKQKVLTLEGDEQFASYIVNKDGEMLKMNVEPVEDIITIKVTNEIPLDVTQENVTGEITSQVTRETVTDQIPLDVSGENVTAEVPLEVTGELILPENRHVKTELVIINPEGDGNICLRASDNYDRKLNNTGDVNLVTIDEGVVQIHASRGQVNISKITGNVHK